MLMTCTLWGCKSHLTRGTIKSLIRTKYEYDRHPNEMTLFFPVGPLNCDSSIDDVREMKVAESFGWVNVDSSLPLSSSNCWNISLTDVGKHAMSDVCQDALLDDGKPHSGCSVLGTSRDVMVKKVEQDGTHASANIEFPYDYTPQMKWLAQNNAYPKLEDPSVSVVTCHFDLPTSRIICMYKYQFAFVDGHWVIDDSKPITPIDKD